MGRMLSRGWWQALSLEVSPSPRRRSSCQFSCAMAPRLVPKLHKGAETPQRGRKTNGKPTVIATTPAKSQAKCRGLVFAEFCKTYFAKIGGGKGKLKEAAREWSKLSPKQKAKHAGRQCLEKGKHKDDEPIAVASPIALSSLSDGSGLSPPQSSGLSLPKRHDIHVGNYTVVQGRAALGSGSYGQLLEVEDGNGERLAMKLFKDVHLGYRELAAYGWIQKTEVFEKVHEAACPFLSVYDFCLQPPLVWMAMPLVGGGDLWMQMKQRKFGEGETLKIMYDAWLALEFLHEEAGILHLDVKPQNMMWAGDKLSLIDFSLWERWPVPVDCELPRDYCTEGFRAPELADTEGMTQEQLRDVVRPALDWWSLGCVGACLARAGLEPRRRPKQAFAFHSTAARDKWLDRVCPVGTHLRHVLATLLDTDPNKRRTVGGAAQLFDTTKVHLPNN